MIAPASAVPEMTLPLLGVTSGSAGATESMVMLPRVLELPAASMAAALITVPCGSGASGVKVQIPLPSACDVPMGTPDPSTSTMTAPASATPLITVPFDGPIVGASGGTASTVVVAAELLLPAASLATAVTTAPSAKDTSGTRVQVPPSSTTACPMGAPLASNSVIVAPTSPVPLNTTPLDASMMGASGATVSMAMLACPLVFPASSTATTFTTVPCASAVSGMMLQVPSSATVVWPMSAPSPSVTMICAPGSATPLSSVPLLASTTGTSGAMASTVSLAEPLTFPAASVAVAFTTVPSSNGGSNVWLQSPFASTTICASGMPASSVSVTCDPASAVPLITAPLVLLMTGGSGATPSTITLASLLTFPAASAAVATTTVPSANGISGVNVQWPFASATAMPIGAPASSLNFTVLPGSAVPLRLLPLLASRIGGGGAAASTVMLASSLVLPALSVAVAMICVPSGTSVEGVMLQLPSSPATTSPTKAPSLSRKVMTAPGSAVPENASPLLGFSVGAAGATPSTTTLVGGLWLSSSSCTTTCTTVPWGSGTSGV